ncbi:transglycosylase domain-containing protein [Chelatococcus sp. GCM10030263]|uniref:transglycosylase domain-containing protein n=1 Tax=Chelatococcus sp. GCM10030263 TaxID=3273387 RepID=UPI003606D7CC
MRQERGGRHVHDLGLASDMLRPTPTRGEGRGAVNAASSGQGRPRSPIHDEIVLTPDDRPGGPLRPRSSAETGGRGAPRLGPGADVEPAVPSDGRVEGEVMSAYRRKRGGSGGGGGKGGGRGRGKGGGRRRRHPFLRRLVGLAFVLAVWCIVGVAGVVAYNFAQLPPIDQLTVPKRPPNIAILANDGSLLANRGDTGGQNVALHDLPPYLPLAFLAIEDRRFYSHFGVDPVGVGRAIFRNITSRGVAEGGSTLTQQLAKNLFLTQERTLTRKIQEAILALWLEQTYTKDQILALYLNRVYFGAGAYGVEAAALRYFGKHASEVTLAEAAMLAGLVQAPSRLSPNRNPAGARARANVVLGTMVEAGFITDAAAKSATLSPATAVKPKGAGSANYAADYVMDVLDDFVGKVDKDIVVETTIDNHLQATAEKALVDELDQKGQKYKASQGALVSLATDGAIRALVGGRNYADSQFNRATAARRQPGSSFKAFVYLAAIENNLTPDTVRDDSPVNIKGWQPSNSSRRYHGPVTLANALAYSINTVAVKLAVEMGPRAVVRTAQRLGITSSLQPNPSIALGTSEVTPLELVAAYDAFANGGIGVIPYAIRTIKTTDGKVLYRRTPVDLGRVIEPVHLGMMNSMMREVVDIGTGKRAAIPGWEVGGKTGTSQDYRDAWFIGYTGKLVTGVWIGNDDNSPTRRASGSNLPVEVWSRYMKVAVQGEKPVPLPGTPYQPAAPTDQPMGETGDSIAAVDEPTLQAPPTVAARDTDRAWATPQQRPRQRGLFEQLFGG